MRIIIWTLLCISFLFPQTAIADINTELAAINDISVPAAKFEHLTTADGLSSSWIWAIFEDHQGFMWFGTGAGLDRYDGINFKNFRNDPDDPSSLLGSTVQDIFEDGDGILWVATNQGLNQFDRKTEKFIRYTFKSNDPNRHSGADIWAITSDGATGLWVLTKSDGLIWMDRKSGQKKRYRHHDENPASLNSDLGRAIYRDRAGNMWIGTRSGLDRFDETSGKFIHYRHDPTNPSSISEDAVWSIYEDKQGLLWIGTLTEGVNSFDPKTGKFTQYRPKPEDPEAMAGGTIYGITEDSTGVLWIASYQGLHSLDSTRQRFKRYLPNPIDPTSITNLQTTTAFVDRKGAIWIGGTGGGVDRLDRDSVKFRTYHHDPEDGKSLGSGMVWTVYEDRRGELWFGNEGSGLHRFNRKNGTFRHYRNDPSNSNSLSGNSIYAIYEDRQGVFWVGGRHGLNRLDRLTGKAIRYNHDPNNPASLGFDDVRGICEDSSGTLWVATSYGGLNRFDRTTENFKRYQHNPENPNSLGTGLLVTMNNGPSGSIWLGLWGGGLNRFDPSSEKFTRYEYNPDNPYSISHNEVWGLLHDSAGNLWAGTSSGLNKLDITTGRFTRYRQNDGLSSDRINTILEDAEHNLWLGTGEGGLNVFNPRTGHIRIYDKTDGLQSNQFANGAAWKSYTGELVFGGDAGFSIIDPSDIPNNSHVPPVVLTGFQLFGRPIVIGAENSPLSQSINELNELILSYHDAVFSLEFAALNYRFSKKNQYSYMLEGFDKKWTNTDSRRHFATYTNLDPGSYTFRVKGSNNDGLWNEEGKSIQISITPPWWQTVWFRLMAILLIIGVLIGGYTWRVRAMNTRNRELEEVVVIRTGELQSQQAFNQAVLENISDGIVACDKQGILSYFNRATREIHGIDQKNLPPEKWAEHYNLFLANGVTPMNQEEVPLFRVFKGESILNEQMVIERTDGKKLVVLASGQAMYNASGSKIGAVISMHDVTEQKIIEAELRKTKEQAEIANQAKSTFLANMSHDLRTPLNAVLGFSEILFHREQDPQNKNYLQSIQSSGKVLLSLINDVLDLSKIEAGKLELQYTAVSMQNLFKEMSTIFQHKISNKGLTLEVQVDTNLPDSLLLDEARLRQVLMNLLGNTIKFTDEGFIRISCHAIETEENIKSHVNLIIEVADSGKGIPTEDIERIFNPFEQVSGQKTSQYGGTGLGLAITKNIINMMNGTITVKSKVGHGSTFRIEINDVEITAKVIGRIENSWDFDPDSIRFSPAKVLIADDIDYNRNVLAGYLNPFSFELYFAENGKVVVEQAQKISPDLILMDMKMPVMDGYEASKILKNGDSTGDIPIVAVTASALAQDEEIIRQYCDDYLRKPISQYDLVTALKKFLKYSEEKKKAPKGEVNSKMTVPTKAELEELHEVALYGDMDQLIVHLDRLEQKNGKLKKFCDQFRSYAVGYKVDKILTLLKEYISK